MVTEKTEHKSLTPQEKHRALLKFLREKGRLGYADGVPEDRQQALADRLVELLLANEQLCGKALFNGVHFVLHDGDTLPALRSAHELRVRTQDDDMYIHVAPQASDATAAMDAAISTAVNHRETLDAERDSTLPIGSKDGDVTGWRLVTGSGLIDEKGRSDLRRGGATSGRARYDPMARKLPGYQVKHTSGDLAYYGKMRTSDDPSDRWLWEKMHSYIIRRSTTQQNTRPLVPGYVCGVRGFDPITCKTYA